ncbi:extracellular solute-binding protein [Flexilinea flocculi]|jgi:multiple sugar transport system substrate-binding protein|uniref:Transcriptional regulator, LacI family n=1 Tax=Flexilinea flocculi TaxID=1678840 RepID=A0A0S7BK31_9CHLR|nr:extracellular solute-binding protein [Flexilinea flocculi]NMB93480.1 extracellular solute-binding protein [Flexilinea flocculi]GAP40741.1 transcriptional regulator, LacI family [Flexilinea flocculi]
MSTIKEVAALAGVSIGTVSNYCTGARFVQPEKAKMIKDAIEKLDYKPNTYAKSLRSRNNQEIGVILPNIYDQYYSFILAGIERELRNSNYYVNLGLTDDVPETEIAILSSFLKKDIRGLIVVSCQTDAHFFEKPNNFITVFIDRKIIPNDINFVSSNPYETMIFLLSQLQEQGYTKIGLMAGPENFSCEKECSKAYYDFFAGKNIIPEEGLVHHIRSTKEESFRTAISFLQEKHPQVIISTSQNISTGIEQAASIIGISTEKDLLIISFSQERWNYHITFNGIINTMRPAHFIGKKAAKLLLNNLKSPLLFEKQQIILKDKIINRNLFENDSFSLSQKQYQNKVLKLLLLNSPNAHTIIQTRFDFSSKTGIDLDITLCEHEKLFDRLVKEETLRQYDILMYDNPWLDILVANHCLADITGFVQAKEFNKDIFLNKLPEKVGMLNNRYYGLPINFGPQLLLYRKDLFDNPLIQEQFEKKYQTKLRVPKTWFEFNVISSFFTRSQNSSSPVEFGTSVAAKNASVLLPELMPRIWAYGGEVFDTYGNVAVDTPEFIKGVTSFIETFSSTNPASLDDNVEKTVEDFYLGKSAMLVGFASFIADVNNHSKSKIIGKIGYDYIPGGISVLGCWGFGISARSNQVEEAFELIRWTCDPDLENYFTILNGQSVLKNVYTNDELVSHYPWLSIIDKIYPGNRQRKSVYRPNGSIVPITTVENLIYQHVFSILQQKCPIETAIKNLRKEIELLIHNE